MSEKHSTQIRWTHLPGTVGRTWNPIRGCELVSAGCTNCYAAEIAARFGNTPVFEGFAERAANGRAYFTGKVVTLEHKLHEPLSWKQPSTIFTCSMADLFHPLVPLEFLDRVFEVMEQTPRHRFLILTKRPERMHEYLTAWTQERDYQRGGDMFSLHQPTLDAMMPANIWCGTSVEDQKRANERIPILLETPAAVRFLSVEPILGPVDLNAFFWEDAGPGWAGRNLADPGIDWVICGGESGKMRRPFDMDWARFLRDQCAAASVAFYFKQAGGHRSEQHPHIDGWKSEQWPTIPLDRQPPEYYGTCPGEELSPEGLIGEAVAI